MGIYIQKSMNGKNADKWMGVLVMNGKKQRISLLEVKGNEGSQLWERTKKQAQAKFEQWKVSLAGGNKTRQEALKIAEQLTSAARKKVKVEELVDYIPDDIREPTKIVYKRAISVFKRLTKISDFSIVSDKDVENWVAKMRAENRKDVTSRLLLTKMSALWARIYPAEYNPFAAYKFKKTDGNNESVRQPLDNEQVKKLLAYTKENDTNFYNIIVVALSTALRKCDIANLRWAEIDFEKKVIVKKLHKTGVIVHLPSFSKLEEVLLSLKGNKSEYVFPKMKSVYDRHNATITRQLKVLMAKAWGYKGSYDELTKVLSKKDDKGMVYISQYDFHALRTTAITNWVKAGLPINVIATMTGHKELDILQRFYNKTRATDFREELEKGLSSALCENERFRVHGGGGLC